MEDNQFKYSPSVWIIPTFLLLVLWSVFYIDDLYNLHLDSHGIFPRTFSGLQGVVFSPFLHGNMSHLANNSISLFLFTVALIYFYRDVSLKVLFYGILFSGIITWIIGRESYHIGGSGLIYVLFSFIFFKGIMTQYYRLVALSLTVISIYGGMFWYVFPNAETVGTNSISWEGHLAGLITGFVFAVRFKTPDYKKALQYDWQQPDFDPEGDKFLERFDENGNFVNKPVEEVEEFFDYDNVTFVYDFKESPKDIKEAN
jgi:membrane associated rhomboid family serine protease